MLFTADGGETPGQMSVGVDLVGVADVDASILRFGSRYTERVYTPGELADSTGPCRAASLAARFAAKEATIKALRPVGDAPGWRSIEVRRSCGGSPAITLYGEALRLAEAACFDRWAVSMSHEGPMAVAVVVAWSTVGADSRPGVQFLDEPVPEVRPWTN